MTEDEIKKNMIEATDYQPVRLQGEKLIKELANLILFFNMKMRNYGG